MIWPDGQAVLMVPLAAHALFARPIVIGSDSSFSLRIDDDSTSEGWIDERMIAHVDVWLPDAHEPLRDWALNDITIERADRGKMVELSIVVDGVEMS